MSILARQLDLALFFSVVVGWLVFGAVFVFRRRPPQARPQARDRRALVGIGFQGVAYAIHRRLFDTRSKKEFKGL